MPDSPQSDQCWAPPNQPEFCPPLQVAEPPPPSAAVSYQHLRSSSLGSFSIYCQEWTQISCFLQQNLFHNSAQPGGNFFLNQFISCLLTITAKFPSILTPNNPWDVFRPLTKRLSNYLKLFKNTCSFDALAHPWAWACSCSQFSAAARSLSVSVRAFLHMDREYPVDFLSLASSDLAAVRDVEEERRRAVDGACTLDWNQIGPNKQTNKQKPGKGSDSWPGLYRRKKTWLQPLQS